MITLLTSITNGLIAGFITYTMGQECWAVAGIFSASGHFVGALAFQPRQEKPHDIA